MPLTAVVDSDGGGFDGCIIPFGIFDCTFGDWTGPSADAIPFVLPEVVVIESVAVGWVFEAELFEISAADSLFSPLSSC